jgi:hypothetical protein
MLRVTANGVRALVLGVNAVAHSSGIITAATVHDHSHRVYDKRPGIGLDRRRCGSSRACSTAPTASSSDDSATFDKRY